MSPGRHRAAARPRARRGLALVLVALVIVVVGQVPGARGAFVAAVQNPTNSARAATYFTCQVAEQGDIETTPIFEYPLNDATGTTTAADTKVVGTPASGTYATSGITRNVANTAPVVCPRDGRTVVSFTGYSLTSGTGGYVSGPAASSTAPTSFSVEVWFKTSTASGRLIGFGDSATGSSGTDDRHLYITSAGRLAFGMLTPGTLGSTRRAITSTAAVTDGAWHDAVATFSSGSGSTLYVDGVSVASDATATSVSYTGYWHLGNDSVAFWPNAAALTGGFITGQMAFAAAYSTVLSPTQVAAHYRAGS